MNLKLLTFIFTLLLPYVSPAQEYESLESWLDLIQKDPSVAEILQDLLENPLAINKATKAQLRKIPMLSERLITKILVLRKQKKGFKNLRQIEPVLGSDLYKRIRPFLVLNAPTGKHFHWVQRNYKIIENTQTIQAHGYSGSNVFNQSKITIGNGTNWQAGLVSQKDAGEANWFDYVNGYLQFISPKVHIIAGSFFLQSAQGLIFSSPFGKMKSSFVILPFVANKDRASPYTGSAENFAQTGLYFKTFLGSKTKVRLAVTRTLRDGQFNPQTKKIIGFDYSGYHRNKRELSKKDIISEQMFAFNATTEIFNPVQIGLNWARFHFTPPINFTTGNVSPSDMRKQYYHFRGDLLNLLSVYYRYESRYFVFHGEWAFSDFKHGAFSQTFFVQQNTVKFGLLIWQLNQNFQSPLGHSFDNHTPFPRAERGIYGASIIKLKSGTIRFYRLIKKNLWRTYVNPLPELSDEWFVQTIIRLKAQKYSLRIRKRLTDSFVHRPQDRISIRFELNYNPLKSIRLRSRFEQCQTHNPSEKGMLMFQDFDRSISAKIRVNARITFFRTKSFYSRIYEYEKDVPGAFSNIALYGQGYKWYVQISWRINSHYRIWLKYRYLKINERDFNMIDYGHISQPLKRLIRMQIEVRY